eukprot:Skav214830  [mRNA]  locus=scaffold1772:235425:237206:- [translate_table: standard]
MSLFFIYQTVGAEREFVPMWSKGFQGFAKLDLSTNERVVNAGNLRTLVRGLGKNEAMELLDMGHIVYAKSKSKSDLQDKVVEKWDEIFTYFCGVMGTDDVSISRGNDVLPIPPNAQATGIVFLKNGRNMTAYWMDTVKGVGSVELGFPAGILPNISTFEALNDVVETLSKKTMEDMLSAYGRRVVCRGGETWMTGTKYHDYLKQNWNSILERAKGDAMMRGHRAPEPEEEHDPTDAISSASQPLSIKLSIDVSFATGMPLEFVEGLCEKFPMDVPIREATCEISTVANLADYVAKKVGLATCEFDIKADTTHLTTSEISPEDTVDGLYLSSEVKVALKPPKLITVCAINRTGGYETDEHFMYFDRVRSTVGDVKVKLCLEKGMNMNEFVLKHGSKVMDTFRRLQEFMDTADDDIIKVAVVGAGLLGGARNQKVIKTILKTTGTGASPTLGQTDMPLFQNIIVGASSLTRATVADAKREFASLDLSVLQQMEEYLRTSKSTNPVKVVGVLDFVPALSNINAGMEKMAWAKETMTKLLTDFLQTECSDETNEVKASLVRKYVEGRIAIKKEQVSQQSAPPVAPQTAPSGGDVAMG